MCIWWSHTTYCVTQRPSHLTHGICEIPFSGPNINFRVLMFLRIQFSTKLKKINIKFGQFLIFLKSAYAAYDMDFSTEMRHP